MKQLALIVGASFGMLAVIFGAFGAHALKKILSPEKLEIFETAVRYQMYSAFFLLIIGFFLDFNSGLEKNAARLVMVGTILFSGSIYALAFSEKYNIPTSVFGPMTPAGGFLIILGWLFLLIYFIKGV